MKGHQVLALNRSAEKANNRHGARRHIRTCDQEVNHAAAVEHGSGHWPPALPLHRVAVTAPSVNAHYLEAGMHRVYHQGRPDFLLPRRIRRKQNYRLQWAEGIENETPVHTVLLLYKAEAPRGLGLLDAARETLTGALRRKKEGPVRGTASGAQV